ncbi:MAG: hypothetical protein IPG51_19265 [Chloroflexi bacterium]|nr:hypothetical protein [Chloroflexota bacterium]
MDGSANCGRQSGGAIYLHRLALWQLILDGVLRIRAVRVPLAPVFDQSRVVGAVDDEFDTAVGGMQREQ